MKMERGRGGGVINVPSKPSNRRTLMNSNEEKIMITKRNHVYFFKSNLTQNDNKPVLKFCMHAIKEYTSCFYFFILL